MKKLGALGFTLVELLTVIAIIAILASLTAVAVPRVLERARLARMDTDFREIATILAEYQTRHGSLPPIYGYRQWAHGDTRIRGLSYAEVEEREPGISPSRFWHLEPWLSFAPVAATLSLYDEYGQSYDTDRDNWVNVLEIMPVGDMHHMYTIDPKPAEEVDHVLIKGGQEFTRPYVYIPVNLKQAELARKYFNNNHDYNANTWNISSPYLQRLIFPPPKYDGYALISVGPTEDTVGILTPSADFLAAMNANVRPEDHVHVLALRAFYLATRDLNKNGLADFDFRARTTGGEGKPEAYGPEIEPELNGRPLYLLPNSAPSGNVAGAGPVIYSPDIGS